MHQKIPTHITGPAAGSASAQLPRAPHRSRWRSAAGNAVQIAHVPLNVARTQTPRIDRNDLAVQAGKAALVFGDQLWLETATAVARDRQLQRLVLRQHGLFAVAITSISRLLALGNLILRRIEVMVHLSIQNPLQLPEQPFGGKSSSDPYPCPPLDRHRPILSACTLE